MAGLDVVALTSFNEGTPVSLIEAQAANKPIATTAVGGIEDVVLPGKTALLSPRDNTEQFASNLIRLVEDETLRLNLGKAGAAFVRDRFSFKRLIADTDALYNRLLNTSESKME